MDAKPSRFSGPLVARCAVSIHQDDDPARWGEMPDGREIVIFYPASKFEATRGSLGVSGQHPRPGWHEWRGTDDQVERRFTIEVRSVAKVAVSGSEAATHLV